MKVKAKFNPSFKPVHECKKRYVVMKGSAGSGKSVDTAQNYIIRLMKDKGRNLVCVRKSDVTNRDSTFSELLGAINRLGVAMHWEVKQSPLQLKCRNGNTIIFRGMNDERQREKLKSITFTTGKLTDVWIEEATELMQDDVEIIDDRLRGELPKGLFYQIKMTFNPVSSSHWIKKVYFDREDEDVMTHHSTYLGNRFIDEGYHRRMERRREVDPDGYRVYGLGEWGELGGLVFSNFRVENISTNLDDYDSVAIGVDFGFNHATAMLTLGYKDGDVYVLNEIYEFEKDNSEIIDIARVKQIPKNILMYCDSAEPDRIKQWKKEGYRAKGVKKGAGSVNAQIDWLKQRKILIHPSCKNTISEINQWKYKKDPKTNEYIDEPVNIFDDAMAALRYGVQGWRNVGAISFDW
ncbi:PBSX family phage terminase large subunit [Peptostreptococcus faecalis]|uniref:PBSX family phage terminase large subunit n=1 Tax=Peptostreptococcus faecalis TaxID=2045015 RepID=UPI000C7CC2CB|nr:PBSX family phage terminase large subunit [Peptostreptococcus faecalis]